MSEELPQEPTFPSNPALPSKPGARPFCRRDFLIGGAAGLTAGVAAGTAAWRLRSEFEPAENSSAGNSAAGSPARAESRLAMPGLYPGRVVEVHRDGVVLPAARSLYEQGLYHRRDEEAVRAMVAQGMRTLTGLDEPVEAWRQFFQRGDRVGIKVVPVGRPDSISSFELVREIVRCLEEAHVQAKDVLVFERYLDEFRMCGYHEQLPDGVHWECSSVRYDDAQLELSGQDPGLPGVRVRHVAGYDRDHYRELDFCQPAPIHDPKDDRRFRSHLSTIISRKVDKFISIPVLKDHRSAGVTLCLKNLSHGSVNNVCRSHIIQSHGKRWDPENQGGGTLNQCQTFIPAMAALPRLREKAVLQIMDGLVATWEGGPGNWNPTHGVWNYNSLFFATDPVALDHVGWRIIDAKRRAMKLHEHSGRLRIDASEKNWPPVAEMGLDALGGAVPLGELGRIEQLHIRQPQHIPLAATLGLGLFNHRDIRFERVVLG